MNSRLFWKSKFYLFKIKVEFVANGKCKDII